MHPLVGNTLSTSTVTLQRVLDDSNNLHRLVRLTRKDEAAAKHIYVAEIKSGHALVYNRDLRRRLVVTKDAAPEELNALAS